MTTISDVAKLAGVSPGTVSRVMNGAVNVNPETRLKVQQAISNLGYQPNFQARSLRSKRTDTIALAIPELTNYFWTTVARGVQDTSQANGYHVLICNTYARSYQNLRYLESIYNRVDGMILSRRSEWKVLTGDDVRQSIDSREKPIVLVGQSQAASWNVDNVYSDSVSGAFTLTEHLIGLGHRQIAIVTGRQSSASASDRVAGYCMALLDAGIPVDTALICWGEYDRHSAERLTHDLIERCPSTTAIVAANNEISIGVIHALEKRKLAVPEEVAVVCFDDFYPDSRFASFMTVASQSPYDLGVNAAQLLLRRLNSDDYQATQSVVLPVRLIIRQSSGGIPTLVEDTEASYERVQGQLISPLPREKILALARAVNTVVQVVNLPVDTHMQQGNKARCRLLSDMLHGKSVDQTKILHFEYAINSPLPYRYILEREPRYEYVRQMALVTPEDQIDFAERCGLAAIACRFPYQGIFDQIDGSRALDIDALPIDFPLFTDQINFFDQYIRAARSTEVGIAADFRSIVADTLKIFDTLQMAYGELHTTVLQKIADTLSNYQSKVVQLICDRFGSELAFVIFSDEIANENGLSLPSELFETIFVRHVKQLIRPVQEHGLAATLYTPGKIDALIPVIQRTGFDAVYIVQPELNDLNSITHAAANHLSLMGGIPGSVLSQRQEGLVEAQMSDIVSILAAAGHYAAGVGGGIDDDIPAQNFFAYLRTLSSVRRTT